MLNRKKKIYVKRKKKIIMSRFLLFVDNFLRTLFVSRARTIDFIPSLLNPQLLTFNISKHLFFKNILPMAFAPSSLINQLSERFNSLKAVLISKASASAVAPMAPTALFWSEREFNVEFFYLFLLFLLCFCFVFYVLCFYLIHWCWHSFDFHGWKKKES